MNVRDKKIKRKSLTKTRIFFWVLLFGIVSTVVYFASQASTGYHNQCENLPTSFWIKEGTRQVEVQVGSANIEVSVNRLVLRPFTVDAYGHTSYLIPQVTSGSVLLNPLESVQSLKDNYAYSYAHFPTTQFYRGSITSATGTILDALFYVERTEVAYVNCWGG